MEKYETGTFDEDARAADLVQAYEARIAAFARLKEMLHRAVNIHQAVTKRYERAYLHASETGSELRAGLTRWIGYYNAGRPRSALAGLTPRQGMWGRSVGTIDSLKETRTELIQAAKRSDRWEHFKIAGPANDEGLAGRRPKSTRRRSSAARSACPSDLGSGLITSS